MLTQKQRHICCNKQEAKETLKNSLALIPSTVSITNSIQAYYNCLNVVTEELLSMSPKPQADVAVHCSLEGRCQPNNKCC